ncbi:MAG: ABC transporter ATP-binding protein NatA [Firmicutes bacterium]|nr:ABC transporter ATP-binding protein NatA [candidate division NPL-UPA2 bacterium]
MSMLEIKNLRKTFASKKQKVVAVDDVSFTVQAGEMVGLLGPNGAGKTTIIKSVLGIVEPDSGTISVKGFDPSRQPKQLLSHTAAVLEGSRNIYWRLSVWENICFFAGIHGISVAVGKSYFEHLLTTFNLKEKRDSEVRLLSQGMKQKVAICCALAKQTSLVFLDEPTLGLDVETSYELRDALKDLVQNEQRTVVVSSHDMDVIQDVCQRAIIVSNGRVIADEKISDLLALFESRTFKLVVDGAHHPELLSELNQMVLPVSSSTNDRQLILKVNLPTARDLYALIDLLREHGAELETINQEAPDLEKVFVNLVRKERERCNGTL